MIYHICDRREWDAARIVGEYRADSLRTEGFIHCSTRDQAVDVANRRFQGKSGLVLLAIDVANVGAAIKYENLAGGTPLFPHIYGPLPVKTVRSVATFAPGKDGQFAWPEDPEVWQPQES